MYSLQDPGFQFKCLAEIRFDPEKPISLNQGQLYVALSRVTIINYPNLIGGDNVDATTYNGLGEQSKIDSGSIINADTHSLKISLLNTRFLRRHAADNSKLKTLIKTDISLC